MENGKQHITDIIFVLSLFCVFAVLALFVVVMGANVYKGISQNMSVNYNARTSVTYITEKIRQNDNGGSISVKNVGDSSALVIAQDIEGEAFETWIYVSDGNLNETMVREGTAVSPGDGQTIMNLQSLALAETKSGAMAVSVVDNEGNSFDSMVYMKSGGE